MDKRGKGKRDPKTGRFAGPQPQNSPTSLANLKPPALANLRHGAYAAMPRERIAAKVLLLAEVLGADAPVRDDDGGLPQYDTVVVEQLAEAMDRLADIGDYLQRRGWEDEDGKPRPVLDYESKLRAHVLELLKELGMTPAARAKLGLDLVKTQTAGEQLEAHIRKVHHV
jgi:P27 family predicted phage terminase small subunit